jgi:K+-transporting ATPase KdpF subunit
MRASRRGSRTAGVNVSYLVLGIICVALLAYLFYALLRPEKF